MKIRPPSINDNWDDCNIIAQAMLLAYAEIREHEEWQSSKPNLE